MMSGRKVISGVSVLSAEYLIPFKMYAWLDLKERKLRGEHVNEKDLKKHKYDVFRLLQIADRGLTVKSSGHVKETIDLFIVEIQQESIPFTQLGLPFSSDETIEYLTELYA